LAVALYPAVAIGTGLLVGRPGSFAGLVGFGAEVVGALGRDRLLMLGESFDTTAIAPSSDVSKVFTAFYIFGGISLIGLVLNELLERIARRAGDRVTPPAETG
jgi:hypothetical protein